jgi:nucleoside recognition membrane protein YjiH
MKVEEEFNVKNAAGKILFLQYLSPKLTYLDFGSARLPRGFQGYRIRDSSTVVEKLNDGTFRIPGSNEVYQRV